ncbi:hypothetical protein HYS28_03305, partial [Candidatus Uhrbacteria bacterium]|nr:hypothetical protein [Candidatus Uhrbacteria bacterium]
MSKRSRPLIPLRDFLYILQLEEYETLQYARSARRLWWGHHFERRDRLRFTARAKATFAVSVVLFIALVLLAGVLAKGHGLVMLGSAVIGSLLTPLIVGVANVLLLPVTAVAKWRVVRAASKRMAHAGGKATVVAVAGSYGKTTTKNFIYQLVRYNFKTQLIEGNINTTMGIAGWIDRHLDPSTELLIVEMDAYHPGEIAASCRMVRPHVAVLTSIGDQHLVRFGSQERIVAALREVFTASRPDAFRVCGAAAAATLREHGFADAIVTPKEGALMYNGKKVACENLSGSAMDDARYALAVAEHLGVPAKYVDDICPSFAVPDRRQRAGEMYGYDAIDDSYNISFATATAGVDAAAAEAKKRKKKLLVLTAGIPELPRKESDARNTEFGGYLAAHADAAVILKSIYHRPVVEGIAKRIPTKLYPNL